MKFIKFERHNYGQFSSCRQCRSSELYKLFAKILMFSWNLVLTPS